MFLIIEKLEETTTAFSQNDVTIMWCNLILQKNCKHFIKSKAKKY